MSIEDMLQKRIHGIAGGHHIAWSAKDVRRIEDEVRAMTPRTVRDVAPWAVREFAAVRRKFAETGIAVNQMQSSDLNFVFPISTAGIDLSNDSIAPGGVDTRDFVRNPVVLSAHDSQATPIAISSTPWVLGNALMAIAKFPTPGISAASDQIAAALRSLLLRGASVGFVPKKWAFSKDPARPLGIDFLETKLLEWSICALPCNPDCLVLGAINGSGKSVSRNARADDFKTSARLREARALVAKTRLIIGDDVPMTRDQRVAQARNFRRAAMKCGK